MKLKDSLATPAKPNVLCDCVENQDLEEPILLYHG